MITAKQFISGEMCDPPPIGQAVEVTAPGVCVCVCVSVCVYVCVCTCVRV